MPVLGYIILATLTVSLISLIGILLFQLRQTALEGILEYLVSFAVGGLLGGAFLHLLPEAMASGSSFVFLHALAGLISFLLVERFLRWRHCHQGLCEVHSFTYINLLGDGVHKFIDGMLIAAAFVQDIRLGLVTTIAVASHELPQELGDFAILVFGGFGKVKALLLNLFCSMAAIAGALVAYYQMHQVFWLKDFLIPFAAGGFIYLALVDMIPELHRKMCGKEAVLQTVTLLAGLGLMGWLRTIFEY